jgi:hypothetical protein
VALVIMAVLAGLVLVCGLGGFFAFRWARSEAQTTQDLNNLRQIGIAIHNDHDATNLFPPAAVGPAAMPPEQQHSWLVAIAPFIEQQAVYDRIDTQQAWGRTSQRILAAGGDFQLHLRAQAAPLGTQQLCRHHGPGSQQPQRARGRSLRRLVRVQSPDDVWGSR